MRVHHTWENNTCIKCGLVREPRTDYKVAWTHIAYWFGEEHGYNRPQCKVKYHGMKEYEAWANMKRRCLNPKHMLYKHYGARGITVCDRWMTFDNFIEDMGYAPSPELSLERIDNDKGYSKENCKWATKSEQLKNRRHYKRVGRPKGIKNKNRIDNLAAIARQHNVPYCTLWCRVYKYNIPLEKAISMRNIR